MYSPITGTGDGSAPVVNITFDYISKDHVKGSVDGVVVELTWTGASQVTFPAAVSSPSTWVVYRETPISIPLVDFANGSVLTEQDLDLANQQLRYHQEEVDGRIDYTNTANEAAIEASADAAAAATSASQAATSAANADTSADAAAASAASASADAATATTAAAVADDVLAMAAIPNATRPASSRASLSALATDLPAVLSENGREGVFVFSSADHSADVAADTRQGVYVAPASDPTGASGAWVRRFSGPLDIRWFGAVADVTSVGVGTDNAAAINGAIAVAARTRGNEVLVPRADLGYRVSSTLVFTGGVKLKGQGYSQSPTATYPTPPQHIKGSLLVWDANVPGMQFFAYTDNLANATAVEFESSYGSTIEDIFLWGGGGTNVNAHGIEMRAKLSLTGVRIENFAGNGLHIVANTISAAVPYGNANVSKFDHVVLKANLLHGGYVIGSDTNNMMFLNVDASNNGGAGILDKSTMGGNNYISCQFDSNNASWGAGTAQTTQAQADYAGLSDQATGSLILDNSSNTPHVVMGTYVEDSWGKKAHLPVGTLAMGGLLTQQIGSYLTATSAPTLLDGYNSTLKVGTLKSSGGVSSPISLAGQIAFTYDMGWGGVAADARINYSSTGGLMMGGNGSAQDFTLFNKNALSVFYVNTGTRNVNFQGDIALNLSTAKITIGGLQVVGPQGGAVANAAAATAVAPSGGTTVDAESRTAIGQLITDNASLRTQLNAALAALRTHGLIAT